MTAVPLGPLVPEATCLLPGFQYHNGVAVTLEPLYARHVDDLWEASQAADVSWAYLKYGPFPTKDDMAAHITRISGLERQPFFAVVPASSGKAEGWVSFCNIASADAAIEIGSVWFSPQLQRTRAATEAIFLMMQHAFTLGYFRVVWRCNDLNAASKRAARRFGFTYEGTWRGDWIVKGRRRDTAWFSIVEPEWPARRTLFETWLNESNFDANGVALKPLSSET